jgi:membrane protein
LIRNFRLGLPLARKPSPPVLSCQPQDKDRVSHLFRAANFVPDVPKQTKVGYPDGVSFEKTLKPDPVEAFYRRFFRAFRRVFPSCVTLTQAVAFNMFLASSPMILVVFGVVASSAAFGQALEEIITRLRIVLPPGTIGFISSFLTRRTSHPWRLIFLGLGGTLLAGTQMMKLLMEGFRLVYQEDDRPDEVNRHVRALLLLSATIIPSILIVNFMVFGRQVRNWMLHTSSMPVLIRLAWSGLYIILTMLVAWAVLAFIYRVGKPGHHHWDVHLRGAGVATVLWWVVSIALGFYLRHVPYNLVYGGLAVTIGIMIWMQLTATIVLLGAAYNAELQKSDD